MNFLLVSALCFSLVLSYVTMTKTDQNKDDKALGDLIQTYLDARKLYQLVHPAGAEGKNEIAMADREIAQLSKQLEEVGKLNALQNMNTVSPDRRQHDFGDYDGSAKGTGATSTTQSVPNTPPPTTTTTQSSSSWFRFRTSRRSWFGKR